MSAIYIASPEGDTGKSIIKQHIEQQNCQD